MRGFLPSGPVASVYEGLAAEEWLLGEGATEEPTLMIWQGPTAVVMGKNQNPWRELLLTEVLREGIPLARRISGGGTVYHDPGNLNISWILPRETYRAEQISGVMEQTLVALGLTPQTGVSGGFRVQGKKVSGAAFCYRKDHVLHHGTLLISADLDRMRRLLAPPRTHFETHAVRSIPAAVANLQDLSPTITQETVIEALCQEATREWGALTTARLPAHLPGVEAQQREDWIWGQTPAFQFDTPSGSSPHLHASVRKGWVYDWKVDGTPCNALGKTPFHSDSIPVWAEALQLDPQDLNALLQASGLILP